MCAVFSKQPLLAEGRMVVAIFSLYWSPKKKSYKDTGKCTNFKYRKYKKSSSSQDDIL